MAKVSSSTADLGALLKRAADKKPVIESWADSMPTFGDHVSLMASGVHYANAVHGSQTYNAANLVAR